MAALIQKHTSWAFSSAAGNGATSISADGSAFEVTLQAPLAIPSGALDAELACYSASVWNTSPNTSPAFGNNVWRYTTSTAPAGSYVVSLPEGLYSLNALGAYLNNAFTNNGHSASLFVLSGDDATQKSIVTIATIGDSIDFGVANSIGPLLGFGNVVITATVEGENEYSDSAAAFNRVDGYYVKSNIVSGGLPINSTTTGIVASIPITVGPGQVINYEPTNPVWVDASDLIGRGRQNLSFGLIDQLGRPTPTAGEVYSLVLVLRWTEWATR